MPADEADGSGSALTPPSRTSLGDDVAERLREAILQGELSGGQYLREGELAQRMQVSRGPVRDAFAVLEQEGLVRSFRHRGVMVMELTRRDLYEIYTLRSALEPLAARLAIENATPADITAIDAALGEFVAALSGRLSERAAARLDIQFHDAIYRASGHERLYQTWSQIRMPAYWFMLSRDVENAVWRTETTSGHARILEAIRARDTSAAQAAISEHMTVGFGRVEASYLDASAAASKAAGATRPGQSLLSCRVRYRGRSG